MEQRQEGRAQRVQQRREARQIRERGRTRTIEAARRERLQSERVERRRELRAQREERRARRGPEAQQRERWRAERLRDRREQIGERETRASRFAARHERRLRAERRAEWRRAYDRKFAARHAWRQRHKAVFIPRLGAVYWPYAYADVFYYTFWPHGYVRGYWAYIYDDFFDTLFWGGPTPYSPYYYAYAGPPVRGVPRPAAAREARLAEALCADPGRGVTAWPFAEIEKAVEPNAEQLALLDDLKIAAEKAAEVFKGACPTSFAQTPPGRLEQMVARLEATREAVRTVRPALAAFYGSLTDEQKARFNEIGPRPVKSDALAVVEDRESCSDPRPGLATLPMQQIREVVRPTAAQQQAFELLGQATEKAVATLQAVCPDDVPETPVGRLEAMEVWLGAMIDAAREVQPALADFYDVLSDEQKARFNTLGRQLVQMDG